MNRKLVALMPSLGACTSASYNDVTYFVDHASVDTYHYKVQFRPEELLRVSGGDN